SPSPSRTRGCSARSRPRSCARPARAAPPRRASASARCSPACSATTCATRSAPSRPARSCSCACTDERQRRPAARIVTSAERMARMIDQLLDFTRIGLGGGLKLEPAAVNLGELGRQLVDETEAALGTTIQLSRLGDTTGCWDADRLAQVLSNLLANAVQHGAPERPVRIRIDGRDPANVDVEVWNPGRIAADILPRIFEPFRGGRYQREQARGLGLGLFIAHEIVRAHGGEVTARSTEAEGTSFHVRLPRRPASASPTG